jgi:hypothetical protein
MKFLNKLFKKGFYSIELVKSNMFKQLLNLKKLTLSIDDQMNLDEKVGGSFFHGLENIEELKLFIEKANYDAKFIRSTKFVSKMTNLQSFRFHATMFDLNFSKVCNLDFIKDLSHILELNLSDNNLSEVKCNVFEGLCNLKILNLVNCHLRTNNLFENLCKLEQLYLGSNGFSILNPVFFKVLINLKVLSLQKNSISNIRIDLFTNLKCLEELDLIWNFIDSIEDNLLVSLKNLKNLILYENNLFSVNFLSLNGLENLEELDLRSNSLNFIHENAFKCCINLKVLMLNKNFDLNLENYSWQSFEKLKHIFLDFCENLKYPLYLFNNGISFNKNFVEYHLVKMFVDSNFLLKKEYLVF